MIFGNTAIRVLNNTTLTSKQIVKFVLFLKKISKKPDKTKRFFWIKAFPSIPLTKKAKGVRMGKGKGKRFLWFTNIKSLVILFEFKYHLYGRLVYFFKKFKALMNVDLRLIRSTVKTYNIGGYKHTSPRGFWL